MNSTVKWGMTNYDKWNWKSTEPCAMPFMVIVCVDRQWSGFYSIEDLLLDEKLTFSGKVPELNSISHPVFWTSSFRSMQFRDINALWLYLQNAINVLHPENLGTLHNNPFDVVVCTTQNFQRRKPLFPCCWGSTRTQLFTTLLPLLHPHDFIAFRTNCTTVRRGERKNYFLIHFHPDFSSG